MSSYSVSSFCLSGLTPGVLSVSLVELVVPELPVSCGAGSAVELTGIMPGVGLIVGVVD